MNSKSLLVFSRYATLKCDFCEKPYTKDVDIYATLTGILNYERRESIWNTE